MAKQSNAKASQEMQMQTLGWILIKTEIEIEMWLNDKTSGNIAKAVGSDDHPLLPKTKMPAMQSCGTSATSWSWSWSYGERICRLVGKLIQERVQESGSE
jgi:hypothetical protein